MKVPVPVNGSRIWTCASDRVVPKSACGSYYAFTHAGRSLSDLHLGYETAKP